MVIRDYGEFDVVHGTHALDVVTGFQPAAVYLAIDDRDFQVCGGDHASGGSAVVTENGFVARLWIKSDTAKVAWIAV